MSLHRPRNAYDPMEDDVDAALESPRRGPSNRLADEEDCSAIKAKGLYFSKVAGGFKLGNDSNLYPHWLIKFTTELEYLDLEDTLTNDPNTPQQNPTHSEMVEQTRQKTVYHMIVHCVNDNKELLQVVTTTLASKDRTGFGAWRALRNHFHGNEKRHLELIESAFESFEWQPTESYSSMETRFLTLTTQMGDAKTEKSEHLRKRKLMEAIRKADRKDAQGQPVFTRLNTLNLVHEKSSYSEWLLAIQTEAQKIQDEKEHSRGTKRNRDEGEEKQENRFASQEVSFVTSSLGQGGQPRHFLRAPRQNGFGRPRNAICHAFTNTGSCKFGDKCRYSHDGSSNNGNYHRFGGAGTGGGGPGNGRFNINGNRDSHPRSNSSVCFEFQRSQQCSRRGCPFIHSMNPSNQANSTSNTSGMGSSSQFSGMRQQDAKSAEQF